jgi:hypothetical protein
MASAALLSLEEFRDTRRRGEIRQHLHGRFDQWLDGLEARVKASQPTVEELTQGVFTLRQELTQAVAEGLVEQAHRGLVEQRTAACPQYGQTVVARGPQERTVETLVGAVRLQRPYFYCERCQLGMVPLDEALQVTERRKQPDVQKAAVHLTKEVPYETACELFEELTGLSLSAHTAHEVTHEVAAGLTVLDVAPSREEILAKITAVATSQPWRPILVLAIDGAEVPTRPETAKGRRPDHPGPELAPGANGRGSGRSPSTSQSRWDGPGGGGPLVCDCGRSPLDLEAGTGRVPLGGGDLGLLPL